MPGEVVFLRNGLRKKHAVIYRSDPYLLDHADLLGRKNTGRPGERPEKPGVKVAICPATGILAIPPAHTTPSHDDSEGAIAHPLPHPESSRIPACCR